MKLTPNKKRSVEMVPDPKTQNKVDPLDEICAFEDYPNLSNVASGNECTGLMYAPPQSEDEFESYQHLSGMQIPKKKDGECGIKKR